MYVLGVLSTIYIYSIKTKCVLKIMDCTSIISGEFTERLEAEIDHLEFLLKKKIIMMGT